MAGTVQELGVRCESADMLRLFSTSAACLPALRCLSVCAAIDVPLAQAILAACPQLRSLRLDGCTVEKDAATLLLGKRGLTEARLRALTVPESIMDADNYFRPQAHAPLVLRSASLQSLRIGRSKDINFGEPSWLPALRSLEVDCVMCYAVPAMEFNDAALLRLTAGSPELRRLLVRGCGERWSITAAVLAPLAAQCARLEELHLAPRSCMSMQKESPTLRDAAFAFPALRTLVAFVDGDVALHCPALTDLHLASAFSPPSHPAVAACSKLALCAAPARVSGTDVQRRACLCVRACRCPTCATDSVRLGDAGLLALRASLAGVPQLTRLDVSNCNARLATLASLAPQLPRLRTLHARANWALPHEVVAAAASMRTGCATDVSSWRAPLRERGGAIVLDE
jgi:hypothetical protein